MKRIYKRVAPVIAAVTMLLQSFLLMGCAAGQGVSEPLAEENVIAEETQADEVQTAESSVAVESGELLTVYFVNDSEHHLKALQEYKAEYGLNMVSFSSYWDLMKQYDDEKASGVKTADVLLLQPINYNYKYGGYIELNEETQERLAQMQSENYNYLSTFHKSVRAGEFCDLLPFMEADEEFNRSDYIESVLDGGKFDGKQYVLPFSFASNSCIVMDKLTNQTGELELNKLDFKETAETLISIRENYGKEYPDNIMLYISNLGAKDNFQIAEMLRISGIKIVDYNTKSVCLDKEELSLLFELMYPLYKEGEEGRSQELQLKYYNDLPATLQIFLVQLNNDYAAGTYRSWEMNSEFFDFEMKMHSIADFDGDYQAVIKKYGVISADSDKKEEGYQLLKHLLDYPCVKGSLSTGPVNLNSHICVNKEHFNQSLSLLANQNTRMFKMEEYAIPVMSEEVQTIIAQHYAQLNEAVIPDTNVEAIVHDVMRPCLDDPTLFDSAYEDLIKRLEEYLAQ